MRPEAVRWMSRAVVLVAMLVVVASHGFAESDRGRLFKTNPQQRQEPVRITSAMLEVRDKEKRATFTGDVVVVQGDTDLRCSELIVYYESEQTRGAPPPSQDDRGNQKIRRMEAKGSVVMTQKDQRAIGEHADFDVVNNTMLLTGDVIVTRGEDIIRGRRLNVNMTTGIFTMEADGGRVDVLLKSNASQAPVPPRPKRSK